MLKFLFDLFSSFFFLSLKFEFIISSFDKQVQLSNKLANLFVDLSVVFVFVW